MIYAFYYTSGILNLIINYGCMCISIIGEGMMQHSFSHTGI
ncbi:hypothetical protein AB205_0164610 [Aquarana catesbeiana]|uniref:Uncharacterized protein n=1 Tax=Aquarana catesbeiana TaxID=8400 RepID=A0A2G9RJZ5_AQUCT|nr:hypothetical protein AB205_0164610 [Aquarana catesbeiana]